MKGMLLLQLKHIFGHFGYIHIFCKRKPYHNGVYKQGKTSTFHWKKNYGLIASQEAAFLYKENNNKMLWNIGRAWRYKLYIQALLEYHMCVEIF